MKATVSATALQHRALDLPEWKLVRNTPYLKVYEGPLVRGVSANGEIMETWGRRTILIDDKGRASEFHFSQIKKSKPVEIKNDATPLATGNSAAQPCHLNFGVYTEKLKTSCEAIPLVEPGHKVELESGETPSVDVYVKTNFFPGAPGTGVMAEPECNHASALERGSDFHRSVLIGFIALILMFMRHGWAGILAFMNIGNLANASLIHPHAQAFGLQPDSAALPDAGVRPDELANASLEEYNAKETCIGRYKVIVAVDPGTADVFLIMPEVKLLSSLRCEEINLLADYIVRINSFLRSKGVSSLNIIYKIPPFADNGTSFGVRWCIREKWGAYQAAGLELAARPFAVRLISTDPVEFASELREYLRS